jgi:hypothetical protein
LDAYSADLILVESYFMNKHYIALSIPQFKNRIERGERTCNICQSRDIEDEFHMICVCPCYRFTRKCYIDKYYERPSMFKLTQLLSTRNEKMLTILVCFLGIIYYNNK